LAAIKSVFDDNKVEISGNSGGGNLNNLVYDGHGWCGWLNTDSMSTDSNIGVSYFDGYGGPLADSFGSRLEELKDCFFADQPDHDITSGDGTLIVKFKNDVAAVINHGLWTLYSSFAQAWASADGADKGYDATMLFFGDWIADENGSFDDIGGYGGGGHFFDHGALCVRGRENHSWLTLDLNGHTINAQGKHRIIYMNEGIRMNIKNGTLTKGLASGGGNDGRGGAIWINDGDIQLDLNNLVFTENTSTVDGAAIDANNAESVNFNTVTVENNYVDSVSDKGCAVRLFDCDIRMYGKMLIRNNNSKCAETSTAYYNEFNLSLGDYIDDMGDINTDMAGSEIGLSRVSTSQEPDGFFEEHMDITEDYAVWERNIDIFKLQIKNNYKYLRVAERNDDGKATLAVYNWD